MAPSDKPPTDRSFPSESDDDNPFIAFRRFADETMSSMLQSFIGLPSSFTSPDPRERWLSQDEQARRRTMESWGGSPQQESGNNAQAEQPDEAAERFWGHSRPCYGLVPPRGPYRPREFPPLSGHFRPWDPFDFDFLTYENTHQPMRQWLEKYLLGSPYSPRYLENMDDLGKYGVAWRMAFEDLLDAQYGRELKSREERIEAFDRNRSLDWAWNMVRKPQFSNEQNFPSRALIGQEEPDREFTELDMYEQFLGKDLRDDEKQLEQRKGGEQPNSDTKNAGLGIVSTLTRTERVVLPDGSTNTKVVLKKRFADGREETSETVHNTKASQETKSISDMAGAFQEQERTSSDKSKEAKGWFWK